VLNNCLAHEINPIHVSGGRPPRQPTGSLIMSVTSTPQTRPCHQTISDYK